MAATDAIIDFVTVPNRSATIEDASVLVAHKGAREATVDTVLANLADAQAEGLRQFNFYRGGRQIFNFSTRKSAMEIDLVEGNIYMPVIDGPFGFDGTREVICVNIEEDADEIKWTGVA